jgi:hypothetical protein
LNILVNIITCVFGIHFYLNYNLKSPSYFFEEQGGNIADLIRSLICPPFGHFAPYLMPTFTKKMPTLKHSFKSGYRQNAVNGNLQREDFFDKTPNTNIQHPPSLVFWVLVFWMGARNFFVYNRKSSELTHQNPPPSSHANHAQKSSMRTIIIWLRKK